MHHIRLSAMYPRIMKTFGPWIQWDSSPGSKCFQSPLKLSKACRVCYLPDMWSLRSSAIYHVLWIVSLPVRLKTCVYLCFTFPCGTIYRGTLLVSLLFLSCYILLLSPLINNDDWSILASSIVQISGVGPTCCTLCTWSHLLVRRPPR